MMLIKDDEGSRHIGYRHKIHKGRGRMLKTRHGDLDESCSRSDGTQFCWNSEEINHRTERERIENNVQKIQIRKRILETFVLRGESKYEFRTVSVQWTLRGWGGQVVEKVDAKECNCVFFIVKRNTGWTLRPGGGGSNLTVHWTLTVRISNFWFAPLDLRFTI